MAIKKQDGQQKFRIPFKNTNLRVDSDVDFTFIKMPKSQNKDREEEADGEANKEPEKNITDYLEFFCQPSSLKLNGGQQGLLNVIVKVNNTRMKEEMTEKEIKKQSSKLLIAKIKDTSLFFDFFVSLRMVSA